MVQMIAGSGSRSVRGMAVVELVREDLACSLSSDAEFPVTAMSTDVALAIAAVAAIGGLSIDCALDVGTGSGLHATVLAAAGAPNIVAIDISVPSLAAAKERFGRVRERLEALVGSPVAVPRFWACDMSTLVDGPAFDLICTNPPSFFRHEREDGPSRTSMDMALFDGDVADGHVAERSFLYRFFADVIEPHLADGGFVVCGWPAIERRIADGANSALVHPAARLHEWFGFTLSGEFPDAERFFSKTAHIRDYGQDGGLLAQVYQDISTTDVYSASLVMTDVTKLTFRYGVLALRKLRERVYSLAGSDG